MASGLAAGGGGVPDNPSPLAQSFAAGGKFNEDFDHSRPHTSAGSSRPQSRLDGATTMDPDVRRSDSVGSQTLLPSRGGTLKKKNSLKRGTSLRRSGSRKSLAAGSVKSLQLGDKEKYEGAELYSAFYTPVPTKGNPTDILANRFQEWRRVLKDLISYYRELQKSAETKAKAFHSLGNVGSNLTISPGLLREGGISDALKVLAKHNKQQLTEANKAKNILEDIIIQLTGLRSDLSQKIKEIKNLSGDFKNTVDKESEHTRKAVHNLQEALGLVDRDASTTGKGDPFIVKLAVERQIEKQIDEENYLHKAFLNLENSGRELESIVVGEIQKAHNAYAGILKREGDEAYDTVDQLRSGACAIPRDHEWNSFVIDNENFVDPSLPIRNAEQITYPGKDAPAAAEVRAGMLERKSKYLKSYTPGWYVLSSTHLHEFKSADRLNVQAPVTSLYLQEQKLGAMSQADSHSHKFMLKGRQTGSMHRGHNWTFRAESRDTMLAWYNDLKSLTEKTGMERDAYVRKHARSMSQGSMGARSAGSSDGGFEEDEADRTPFSPVASQVEVPTSPAPVRPRPGGRFPSDLNIQRGLRAPLSPSSGASSESHDAIAAASALPGSGIPLEDTHHPVQSREDEIRNRQIDYQENAAEYRPQQNYISEQTYPPMASDGPAQAGKGFDEPITPSGSALVQTAPLPRQELAAEPVTAATTAPPAGLVDTQSDRAAPIDPQVLAALVVPEPERLPPQSELPERHPDHGLNIEGTQSANTRDGEPSVGTNEPTQTPALTAVVVEPPPSSPLLRPEPIRRPSDTATQASVMTTMTDSTAEVPFGGTKPPLLPQNSVSTVNTISDLHIPGEFPRSSR